MGWEGNARPVLTECAPILIGKSYGMQYRDYVVKDGFETTFVSDRLKIPHCYW